MRRTRPAPGELAAYLADVRRYPLLSPDEERTLAEAARAGDAGARERLACCNLRLVVGIALGRRFEGRGLDLPDLIQLGNLGLLRAIEDFDPGHGRFSTYATWWVRQAITLGIYRTARTIRLPTDREALLRRWRRAEAALVQRSGHAPDPDEVAASLGLSDDERGHVAESLRVAGRPIWTGQAGDMEYIRAAEPTEAGNTYLEMLAVDRAAGPAERADSDDAAARLRRHVDALPAREAAILRLRFGLDGGPPHLRPEIGRTQGCTGERIRQVESRALRRLRDAMGGES